MHDAAVCFATAVPQAMLKNAIALLATTVLVVLGIMFSVVLLAVFAVLGIAAWAYLWWKTRKLRDAMQQQAQAMAQDMAQNPEGRVIEGEAVVVEDIPALTEPATSAAPSRPPSGPDRDTTRP
jgi:type III secretory pathway component EscV